MRAFSARDGGEHVFPGPNRQHRTARDPRHSRGKGNGDRQHRLSHAAAEKGDDEQREEQFGHRQQPIEDAHDDAVDPAARGTCDHTDDAARAHPQKRRAKAKKDCRWRAVQQPRQQVATELIGAQPMRCRRSLQTGSGVEGLRIVRRHKRPEYCGPHDQEQQAKPGHAGRRPERFRHSAPSGLGWRSRCRTVGSTAHRPSREPG